MGEYLEYQILALDPGMESRCQDSRSLLHAIRGISALWSARSQIDEGRTSIVDDSTKLVIGIVQNQANDGLSPDVSFGKAFIVTLCGEFEQIESLRLPLTTSIRDLKFARIYVLKDEVSQHIAIELYPYLYRIENQLRGYLIKAMTTKVGANWWEESVSIEVATKAKQRKGNEPVFGKIVDNSPYLVDFEDLGQIVYKQTSRYLTREDIIQRIDSMEQSAEAVEQLKRELQPNYIKLFKESFADKGFERKWKEFEKYRHKIAHGNLFTAEDLDQARTLANEIACLISEADRNTERVVVTASEQDAIRESLASESTFDWQDISEEQFLHELEKHEGYFASNSAFVGVALFKRNLSNLGYSYHSVTNMIEHLKDREVIEIYSVPNPDGPHDTSAIRLIRA